MAVSEPFRSNGFYEHEPNQMIFCGACARIEVEKSLSGEYTFDEAVFGKDFRLLTDDDTEPYMCELCTAMNDAYEELGDD